MRVKLLGKKWILVSAVRRIFGDSRAPYALNEGPVLFLS